MSYYLGPPGPPPEDKSIWVSLVLTFLFGPLGVLYVDVLPALILTVLGVVAFAFTLGFALIPFWLISMVYGCVRAGQKHSDYQAWLVQTGANHTDRHSTGPLGPTAPSQVPGPGWYPDPGMNGRFRWWDGRTWTNHLS